MEKKESNGGHQTLIPNEIARLLQAAEATVRAEFGALPSGVALWHPAQGEWCSNEALGHIIEAERRGFAGRIRQIIGGGSPQLINWDQVAIAQARRDCERNPAEVVAEFNLLREESVALVKGLRENDLELCGHHPQVGYLRVQDLLHEWVHHDRNHLRQILANTQAFVWEHMGNARRFSEE
ncbi:MAG: DinB family protein [Dehalococcoidia bacterium]